MVDIRAFLRVCDFFIPAEVLSAVLMIFAMENVLDYVFTLYVPPKYAGFAWAIVYLFGVTAVSGFNFLTAEPEDLDELSDDIEDL